MISLVGNESDMSLLTFPNSGESLFLTNALNFVLLTLTNLLGGSFFQVRNKIVQNTFLHRGPNG